MFGLPWVPATRSVGLATKPSETLRPLAGCPSGVQGLLGKQPAVHAKTVPTSLTAYRYSVPPSLCRPTPALRPGLVVLRVVACQDSSEEQPEGHSAYRRP